MGRVPALSACTAGGGRSKQGVSSASRRRKAGEVSLNSGESDGPKRDEEGPCEGDPRLDDVADCDGNVNTMSGVMGGLDDEGPCTGDAESDEVPERVTEFHIEVNSNLHSASHKKPS
mmetsp:Transcript_118430/g.221279  ORF Transcript_118430/g.221279 Transcript_118430/m.221279 type:complete len:117 (-) Transcript_118430:52-402(-)